MLHDELCRHWQLKGLPCPLHNSELIQIRAETIASYPGLLTPVLSLAVLTRGRTGKTESHAVTYLDVWRSSTFLLYAVKWLSASKKCRQDCLMSSAQSFYGPCLRSVVHSLAIFLGMFHSSTRPGTLLHVTQFYQAFPHISTASEKCWDEKVWV